MFCYLQDELATTGYDIIPTTNKYVENERSHIEIILAKKKVDGLIINRDKIDNTVFELLEHNNIPCVFIATGQPDTKIKYSVRFDPYQSGYIVGEHFAKKGFLQIVSVLGPKETTSPVERQNGLLDALRNYGNDISYVLFLHGDYSYESGYRLTKENIDYFRKAQAVYYQSDACAIGGIRALRENGIDLGKLDVVTGDGTPITEWYSPSLTTVKSPAQQIAKEVVRLMLKMFQDRESISESIHTIIQPSLIIRESSR